MKIMCKLDIIKMKVPECLTRIESKRLQVPIMPNNLTLRQLETRFKNIALFKTPICPYTMVSASL